MNALVTFYKIICVLLMICHTIYYTILYMQYSIFVKAAPYTPASESIPKISLCFNLNYLLDKQVSRSLFDNRDPEHLQLTTYDLFHSVPAINQTVQQCTIRDSDTDILNNIPDRSECMNRLNIRRFKLFNLMCYRFDLNTSEKFSFFILTSSAQRRILYSVSLNSMFRGHPIYPILHVRETPVNDVMFSQEFFTSPSDKQQFVLTYQVYEMIRLPSPYETMCQQSTKIECLVDCYKTFFQQQGSLSPWTAIDETQCHGICHLTDPFYSMTDKSAINLSADAFEHCYRKSCHFDSCHEELIKTYHIPPETSTEDLKISVSTAHRPRLKIKFEPMTLFHGYVTQVVSLASIWIDFSFLSALLSRKNNKLKSRAAKLLYNSYIMCRRLVTSSFVSLTASTSRIHSIQCCRLTINLPHFTLVLSIIFRLIVLHLLIFQLYQVINNYAQYKTVAQFKFILNPRAVSPRITTCINVEDLLGGNFTFYYYETTYDKSLRMKDKSLKLSLKQLFHRTWTDKVLFKCRIRDFRDKFLRFKILTRDKCLRHFRISKFYYHENFCYTFTPVNIKLRYYQSSIRRLTHSQGILYSLIFNPRVQKFDVLRISSQFSDDSMIDSLEYGAMSFGTNHKRTHRLSNLSRKRITLPPPYDTKCVPFSASSCLNRCYQQLIGKIDRLPYSAVLSGPSDLSTLSYTDLTNETINTLWLRVETECRDMCNHESCFVNYTQTFLSHPINSSEYAFELIAGVQAYPGVITRYQAIMHLNDLCYQLFSTLNFWIGFSFIYPVHYLLSRRHRLIDRLFERLTLDLGRVSHHIETITDKSCTARVKKLLHSRSITSIKEMCLFVMCVLGCVIHMPFAVISYMKYPTILQTSESLESVHDYGLTICIDWRQLFHQRELNTLTLSHVFARTPSEVDLIDHCAYWGLHTKLINNFTHISDRLSFTQHDSTICNELYNVTKFFRFNYMCYLIDQVKKLEWSRNQMNNVLEDQKLLLMLALSNDSLTHMYRVIVTAPSADKYPLASIRWSPHLTKYNVNIWYRVTYQSFLVIPLPPPYSDDGYTNMLRFYCIEDCVTQHLAEKQIDFHEFYRNPIPGRMIPSIVDSNVTLNKLLKIKEITCRQVCEQSDQWRTSYNPYYYTQTEIGFKYEDKRNFGPRNYSTTAFYLYSADQPVITIEHEKKISFFELIITMGNIISIWFGVSVVSMNPFIKRQHVTLHHLLQVRCQLDRLNQFVSRAARSVATTR